MNNSNPSNTSNQQSLTWAQRIRLAGQRNSNTQTQTRNTGQQQNRQTTTTRSTQPRARLSNNTTRLSNNTTTQSRNRSVTSTNNTTNTITSQPAQQVRLPNNIIITAEEIGASSIQQVGYNTYKVKNSGPLSIELTYSDHGLEQMKKRGLKHIDVSQAFSSNAFLSYDNRLVYTAKNGTRVVINPESSVIITVINNNDGLFAKPGFHQLERINGDQNCETKEQLEKFYKGIIKNKSEHTSRMARAAYNLGGLFYFSQNFENLDHPSINYFELAQRLGHPNATIDLANAYNKILDFLSKQDKKSPELFSAISKKAKTCINYNKNAKHPLVNGIRGFYQQTDVKTPNLESLRNSTKEYPLDGCVLSTKVEALLKCPSVELKDSEFIKDLYKLAAIGNETGLVLLKALLELNYISDSSGEVAKAIHSRLFKLHPDYLEEKISQKRTDLVNYFKAVGAKKSKSEAFIEERLNVLNKMDTVLDQYPTTQKISEEIEAAQNDNNLERIIYWTNKGLLQKVENADTRVTMHNILSISFAQNKDVMMYLYHAYEAYKAQKSPQNLDKFIESLKNPFGNSTVLEYINHQNLKNVVFNESNDESTKKKQGVIVKLLELKASKSKDKQEQLDALRLLAALQILRVNLPGLEATPEAAINTLKKILQIEVNIKELAKVAQALKSEIPYIIGSIYFHILNDTDKAEQHFKESMKYGKKVQKRGRKSIVEKTLTYTKSNNMLHTTIPKLKKLEQRYGPYKPVVKK